MASVSAPATEDPRVGRSRQVVRLAVLEQLAEVGFGALTIEAVARRAGVGKSTIYRHWPSRVELIADALENAHHGMVPDIESGSARNRVVCLVEHVAEVLIHPLYSRCILALIEGAEHDELLRAFHYQYSAARRNELASLIADGVKSGEFDSAVDTDAAAVSLLGVIFYRRLMTPEPFEPMDAEVMVAKLLCQSLEQKAAGAEE